MFKIFPGFVPAMLCLCLSYLNIFGTEVIVTTSDQLVLPNVTLVINVPITLGYNITVDATSTLRFSNGGLINVGSNTLTINGGIEAGLYQVFDISGGGKVKGNPKVLQVVPQWFGSDGEVNGDSDDDAPAFQAAIDLIPKIGGKIYIPAGNYQLNESVYIPYKPSPGHPITPNDTTDPNYTDKIVNIVGEVYQESWNYNVDKPISQILLNGDCPAFRINSRDTATTCIPNNGPSTAYKYFTVKNISIQQKVNVRGTGIYALHVASCLFDNMYFSRLKFGINTNNIDGSYYEHITLRKLRFNKISDICFNGGQFNDALLIENCYVFGDNVDSAKTTGLGFNIIYAKGVTIIGGIFNYCKTIFNFVDCSAINVSGIYSESNINGDLFRLCMTSAMNIQNSYFLVGTSKLVHSIEQNTNIQFIGNRILVGQDYPSSGKPLFFSEGWNPVPKQYIFIGNQVGYWTGPRFADINNFDLRTEDQVFCKVYSALDTFKFSNKLLADTLKIKDKLDVAGEMNVGSVRGDISFGHSGNGILLSCYNAGPRSSLVSRVLGSQPYIDIGNSSNWAGITLAASGGNVGIGTGTSVPGAKLDVVGDAKISGNIQSSTAVVTGALTAGNTIVSGLTSNGTTGLNGPTSAGGNISFGYSGNGILLSCYNAGPRSSLVSRALGSQPYIDIGNSSNWAGITLAASGGNVGIGTGTSAAPNSTLQVNGSFAGKRTPVTGTTYTTNNETIIGVSNSTNPVTITLATTDAVAGRILIIKDEKGSAASKNITVARNGRLIDGGTSNKVINTNWGVLKLYSDGTNWFTF